MTRVHDPLCLSVLHPGPHGLCDCGTIHVVRADERERIAAALIDNYGEHRGPVNLSAVLRIIGATRGDAPEST